MYREELEKVNQIEKAERIDSSYCYSLAEIFVQGNTEPAFSYIREQLNKVKEVAETPEVKEMIDFVENADFTASDEVWLLLYDISNSIATALRAVDSVKTSLLDPERLAVSIFQMNYTDLHSACLDVEQQVRYQRYM